MKNLRQRFKDVILAVIGGLIVFICLSLIDYFININTDIVKKILSSIAGGIIYFIKQFKN